MVHAARSRVKPSSRRRMPVVFFCRPPIQPYIRCRSRRQRERITMKIYRLTCQRLSRSSPGTERTPGTSEVVSFKLCETSPLLPYGVSTAPRHWGHLLIYHHASDSCAWQASPLPGASVHAKGVFAPEPPRRPRLTTEAAFCATAEEVPSSSSGNAQPGRVAGVFPVPRNGPTRSRTGVGSSFRNGPTIWPSWRGQNITSRKSY